MQAIPEFCPRFLDDHSLFEDGRMFAAVDLFKTEGGGKGIVIHEWSSNFPGNGHSEQALRWFRESGFSHISANGVGLIEDGIGDIATAYWLHMHKKGLVDTLIDDNGVDITPPITPERRTRSPCASP